MPGGRDRLDSNAPVRPPGSIARHRLLMRARQRAKTMLARLHAEEFEELTRRVLRDLRGEE